MKKMVYRLAQKMYQKKLLPWCVWSFVYDHCHKAMKAGEQW